MARTKVTVRRNDAPKIFVPRPQGEPNIRQLRAGDKPWKRKLTDAIAKSDQIQIVNRTRKKQTEKPKFKIKKAISRTKNCSDQKRWANCKSNKL